MSLLGIDVGTTGCKCAAYSADGALLASAYAEYALRLPQPGWAELHAREVWTRVCETVRCVAAECDRDPVACLAVASLGEAVVPVTEERRILGDSILCVDTRGEEYLPRIGGRFAPAAWYEHTGQLLANHYGLPKLMWLAEHAPALVDQAAYLLPWSSFVAFMLGGEPVTDFSHAERLSCLDIERRTWSPDVVDLARIPAEKLPRVAPAATPAGRVSHAAAAEVGLRAGTEIIVGCHDQCAVAVGSGAIAPGPAALGLGTFVCLTPVLAARPPVAGLRRAGLNTEHHAVADRFVTLIYNQGGVLVRWFRDTFAAAEHAAARTRGEDAYPTLFAEVTDEPGRLTVVPTFVPTGPPEFLPNPRGLIAGLGLDTTRGEVLKAILEGTIFYLREVVEEQPPAELKIGELRASGGGSRSDRWLQIIADILERPVARLADIDAGLRGAAIIAGVGAKTFASFDEGVRSLVRLRETFEPRAVRRAAYTDSFARYRAWRAAARRAPNA